MKRRLSAREEQGGKKTYDLCTLCCGDRIGMRHESRSIVSLQGRDSQENPLAGLFHLDWAQERGIDFTHVISSSHLQSVNTQPGRGEMVQN